MTHYHPPIKERKTDELLSIIENVDDWKEDALLQARRELQSRGYSVSQQKRREQSEQSYRRRVSEIKANATFSDRSKIMLFIFAPYLLIANLPTVPLIGCGETTWELKNDGFKKKWKQRLVLTTLGNLTWLIILMLTL